MPLDDSKSNIPPWGVLYLCIHIFVLLCASSLLLNPFVIIISGIPDATKTIQIDSVDVEL